MEQINNSIIFYAHYIAGKVGKTGLTPTISVWKVTEAGVSSKIVTAAAVTEVGGGYYFYRLTNTLVDSIGEYLGLFTTTDSTVNQQDIPTCIPVGRGGVEYLNDVIIRNTIGLASANLDTQLADIPTVAEFNARSLVAANYATAASLNTLQTSVNTIDDFVDTEVAAIKVVTDKLGTMVEPDGANSRYTTASLVNAPTGGGGGATDWTDDEKTVIRSVLGIPTTGTIPVIPSTGVLDAIKDKTDIITPLPAQVNANIIAVNSIPVTGAGIPGTDGWRPA